jgi:hypothetical protein
MEAVRGAIRKRTAVLALALVVPPAIALVQLPTGEAGPEPDAVAAPGVFESHPFRVELSGPLWRSRSLRDRDGAADFAIVADDLPLDIHVRASGRARVAAVEVRVDGRRQRVPTPDCGEAGCPAVVTATSVPALRRLAAGRHRVEVYAGATAGRAPARRATFYVRTAPSAPAVVEGQTARKDPAPAARAGDARLARSALAVLAAERARPGLAAALSRSRVSVIQAGPLNARRRRLGVTLWVALAAPARDVRATVPGYVPSTSPTGPAYTPQTVRMHVAVLRDALIDVDLSARRVIAFEPGPRSRTISWQPSRAPAPAGAGDEDRP